MVCTHFKTLFKYAGSFSVERVFVFDNLLTLVCVGDALVCFSLVGDTVANRNTTDTAGCHRCGQLTPHCSL